MFFGGLRQRIKEICPFKHLGCFCGEKIFSGNSSYDSAVISHLDRIGDLMTQQGSPC